MESKIEATRRLQREGRWDEASAARDREKTRLIESGLTRREANPASWVWMIEHYPPLSKAGIVWNETQAQFPLDLFPDCLVLDQADDGYRFSDLWWVYRYIVARDVCIRNGDAAGALEIEQRMLDDCSSKHATVLSTLAIAAPDLYFDIAEYRFERAMFSLIDLPDPAGDAVFGCIAKLEAFLEAIPAMHERLGDLRSGEHDECTITGLFGSVLAA